jgi:dihydroneopterin aldolase
MARLTIKGLRYLAPHGVHARERITGNLFEVDIILDYDTSAAVSGDDVSKSIDYSKIAELTGTVMNGEPVNLIETLASRIGEAILRRFATVDSLGISVRKYKPEIGTPVEFTEITHSWNRP